MAEAQKRLKATKDQFPNVGDDFVGMARKSDIKQIDGIVKKLELNKSQRRLLHDEITGQELSIDDIRSIAEDIAKFNPKGGR